MKVLLAILIAAHTAFGSFELPAEIDSIPLPFQRIPFSLRMEADRLLFDCNWIGAKHDSASALFIFEGPLICVNSTGKWITESAYDAPQLISCLTTDISFYAWPEYCNLFDVQDSGSAQRIFVFQDRENYCPSDAELQLADGTQMMEFRCMGKVLSLCELPQELGIASIPLQFRPTQFAVMIGEVEDRVQIDCFWIGAKHDPASSMFVFGGLLMCENGTGKWETDAGYESPPIMSCLSSDVSFYGWPEYCYLFDVQENGSSQMIIVFQGRENYCASDAELQLLDGGEISALRCLGKGGSMRKFSRNVPQRNIVRYSHSGDQITSEKKEKSEMDEEPSMLVSIGVLAIFATCLPTITAYLCTSSAYITHADTIDKQTIPDCTEKVKLVPVSYSIASWSPQKQFWMLALMIHFPARLLILTMIPRNWKEPVWRWAFYVSISLEVLGVTVLSLFHDAADDPTQVHLHTAIHFESLAMWGVASIAGMAIVIYMDRTSTHKDSFAYRSWLIKIALLASYCIAGVILACLNISAFTTFVVFEYIVIGLNPTFWSLVIYDFCREYKRFEIVPIKKRSRNGNKVAPEQLEPIPCNDVESFMTKL
ncbi:hypothetical protein PRIPAC_85291 [Pristionchus pacificus]|uniref:CWH43-like N-terminal domain-containing protein n=1 Tax=Pristionchus pacificus TaxID=54126 RepID=A0A2A6BSC0_PRIPA|nr:hypothetical protein PRIPAC_85291 [Pristionchus pacificus]|eukprot:PDM68651.1 hypothetical protein PRIPAC_46953 [Pristionchus pacificus]